MKSFIRVLLFSLVSSFSVLAYTNQGSNVLLTDGSVSDTQAAIDAASDGYTVRIPAGTFTWSSGVRISGKGVHLQGAGSGRVVGRSLTSLAVGTGSRTLTTQAGLPLSVGQTVKIIHTAHGTNWMQGTVSSYSGTSLTVNVTSSGGSGTWAFWVIATNPATTVTLSSLSLTEDASHSVEVSGIKFIVPNNDSCTANPNNGKPILIHDCWFSIPGSHRAWVWRPNRGVIYRCSIDAGFNAGAGTGSGWEGKFMAFKNEGNSISWSTASTMGSADVGGVNNTYLEDMDFHGMYIAALDFDDNSRTVLRRSLLNNSGLASHGADSSPSGLRHFEIYDNEFVTTVASVSETYNIFTWLFLRGGTGIITDNLIPNLISQHWGDKAELNFIVMNLGRSVGPYGCWRTYPAPHQIGQGHNGSTNITEPLYIWNNSGGGNQNPFMSDYTPNECGAGAPSSSQFLVAGRDYVVGVAKPGYSKYTYPHPLRSGGGATNPPPPTLAATPTPTPLPTATPAATLTPTPLLTATPATSPTPTPVAGAATYYIDQTAGIDSNSGTSPASAWKNCPGMSSYSGSGSLKPGDTVYFDRSDTWQTGPNPTGPGLELKGGVRYVGNQWDPESAGPDRAILQAVGRQEAGNVRFWEDDSSIATQFEGFEVDGNGYRANGIDINHAFWRAGLIRAVKRINDCIVHGQTGNGAEGDYKYGVIVSDHSPNASGQVANVEILDTTVYNAPRVGIAIYPGDSGLLSEVIVRGCTVYDIDGDPTYPRAQGIVIKGNVRNTLVEYCYVRDVGASALFINGPESGEGPGPTSLVVRYNILQCAAPDGVIRFYGSGTKSVDVYGNIVLENEVGGGISFSGNSGGINARIYNNTFFDSFVGIGNPSSTGTIEFRNNIVYEQDDLPFSDSGSDVTGHSNNLYYRANGGTLVSTSGGDYASSNLALYEVSGSSGNPQFTSPGNLPTGFTGSAIAPNNNGLSLQSGSPGINDGTVLDASFNGSINSVPRPAAGAWDIGAYEMGSASSPPPTPSPGAPTTPTNLRVVPDASN